MQQTQSLKTVQTQDIEQLFEKNKEEILKKIFDIKDKYGLSYKELTYEIVKFLYQEIYLFR
jgi:hypothetical protein